MIDRTLVKRYQTDSDGNSWMCRIDTPPYENVDKLGILIEIVVYNSTYCR